MRLGVPVSALIVATLICLVQSIAAEAADVRVLCTSAITPTANELFAQFERDTGHKVLVRYEFGPNLRGQVDLNESFDVAIVSFEVQDLIKRSKIADGTRVAFGVAVRKGAPKPDISTTDALKRTLLSAKSISYSAGSSESIILGIFDRLGVANDIKAKSKSSAIVSVEDAISKGERELVINGVAVILRAPEAELVGWLPVELQSYVVFTGGVSAAAKQAEAGSRALLRFLTTPMVVAMLKGKGIEPTVP